jgi:REP element-mobilizing transposase RayT
MAIARSEVVIDGVEAVYHCISRCVRRAFLCGTDTYSGKNYEHRKEWIRLRIQELTAGYAIEVSAYAVMSNHLHVVLRTRPDWVDSWTDQEVAIRWLKMFSRSRMVEHKDAPPSDSEIKRLTDHAERMTEIRSRLSSVSWFMRSLNEHVARLANREDGCKGRFWEGRFKCQALLDEAAVLACMAYVDLNPIRAGLAATPEDSDFTSVKERIEERRDPSADPSWLCPIGDEGPDGWDGILSMTRDEYLALIDWTGRQVRSDKPGAIPDHLAPIMARLAINQERWVITVSKYGSLFHRVAGRVESMVVAARQAGKWWLGGLSACRQAFSPA